MKRSGRRAAVLAFVGMVALMLAAPEAAAQQDAILRSNIGIILDTPFLTQEELPYQSEFSGPYGDELITYEYDGNGMPVFIRVTSQETGIPTFDVEVSYRSNGHLDEVVYLSWDEAGGEILYRDVLQFDDATPGGPTFGTLTLNDGDTARLRITYDSQGRLAELEEDNAFGEGLFRYERYAWAQTAYGTVPFAVQIEYRQANEVERYTYLYDALGRLARVDGYNVVRTDLENRRPSVEDYFYRREGYDDLFGPVEPSAAEEGTAAR